MSKKLKVEKKVKPKTKLVEKKPVKKEKKVSVVKKEKKVSVVKKEKKVSVVKKEKKPSIKQDELSEKVLKTKKTSELKSIIKKLKKSMPVEGTGSEEGKVVKKDLIRAIMKGGTKVRYIKVKTPKKDVSFIEIDRLGKTPLKMRSPKRSPVTGTLPKMGAPKRSPPKMGAPKRSPVTGTLPKMGAPKRSPPKTGGTLPKMGAPKRSPLGLKISSPIKPRSPSQNISRIWYPIQYKKINADIEKMKKLKGVSPTKGKARSPLKVSALEISPSKYQIYSLKKSTAGFTRKSPSPKKLVIETRSYNSPIITRSYTPIKTENPLFGKKKSPSKSHSTEEPSYWGKIFGY